MADTPSLWSRLRSLVQSDAPKPPPVAEAVERVEPPPSGEVKAEPALDLIIGFDFGTSCSKVVVGDPDWLAQSFAVSFESPAKELRHWLLPTRLGDERNLKLRLMEEPQSESIQDIVALYFAYVIYLTQAWFTENAPAGYRRAGVQWNMVVGFPEKEFGDSPLSNAYRDITRIAVRLAGLEGEITTEDAQRVRRDLDGFVPVVSDNRIHFYPEIAAQLAGYINSPFCQRGNLLLIDVGAGTMDVSTLIVHGNAELDVVSFHVCEVKPLGALRLLEQRIAALRSLPEITLKVELLDFQDTLRPAPECLSDIVSTNGKAAEEAFEISTGLFADGVIDSALSCLSRFRKIQREVHTGANFDPWGRNLRFFLTGGGSRSEFYRHHLAAGPLEQRLAPYTRWNLEADRRRQHDQGFRVERLPVPEKFHNFPDHLHPEFDRLSVAHGLAFGGPNLMKITRSSLS